GYNVITILFMIFPPFTAFAINVFIMDITAFWGMRILLLKYVGKETGEEDEKGKESSDAEKHRVWIITGVSLCFAMLPFYPSGGLSIAGLPLLVYSYLNIKNNESSKKEYLYIALYPFYSVLPFAGMFVIMALFVIFVIDTLKKRRIHTIYIAVLTGMSLLYLLTHFHMIYSILDPEFVSYREELKILPMSFAACFKTFIHNIIYDKSNIIQAQRVFVMIAAAGAVYLGIKRNIKQSKILMYMLLFTVFNAFLWGFKYWQGIHFLREKYQVLNALNLARFYWLNPFLWSVVFALSLLIISKIKKGKAIATFLLMGQVVFMFTHYNWEYRSMSGWKNPVPYSLSYGEYYSEGLFEEIGQYIGKPRADYRVASIGLPAGIAQYNGFYTLDIFSNVYPLEYKHRFREIIAKELEKSARVKRAFDENGKRCYLTPAEIQGKRKIIGLALARGLTKKEQRIKIKNLEINTEAFGKMGGEYIISAVEIRNYKANQLTFEKIFENNKSPWKIYLYKRKAT
ncbi:MAG: hypothetical protein GY757_56165, partial [bacterium]|nr:hypothetical protein [bacterium]